MWFPSVLDSLKSAAVRPPPGRARRGVPRKRPATYKLKLEVLEDRTLLSTTALFDLATVQTSPFPSDRFTVADQTQNSGLRVNMPLPDCVARPSDCEDLRVINTLDGFNLQPRLSIPFDGPIDVNSVSSSTVFLIGLGDTLNHNDHGGQVVGINQVVWDIATNTLHVKSDELLDQHTRYALIVTTGVHDPNGAPVETPEAFRHFRQTVHGEYKHELLDAIHAARRVGVRERDLVTASVFTTQSVTAVLEKIRDQIKAGTPAPADFVLGPGGTRTVFPLDHVQGIAWKQQVGADPPQFNDVPLDVSVLRIIPGAVGEIAFGKYLSPDYEVHPGEYIPPVATLSGTPAVQGVNEIFFNLFLPSGPRPDGGWPVAIFGHGFRDNKQGASLSYAASMAAHGIATIAINVVGHGFGPLGTLTVNQTVGGSVAFLAGGRGIDQDGDHIIGVNEGVFATAPRTIIGETDANRQTVGDLMQLVRVIQVGMHVDGNGGQDLDPSRIYYVGRSVGAQYGTDFLAVEPDVRSGVLIVAGGSFWETLRLGPGNRNLPGSSLATRVPSLINSPGITILGGLPASAPYFNENMPLRNGIPLAVRLEDGTDHIIQSPVINDVVGAMEIQEVLENRLWVNQSANPVAYAPHLRKNPLAGVPAKSVIIQFAKTDQIVQNPTTTALLRAGDLADRATYYRNDLAFAEDPAVPKNPHGFANLILDPDPLVAAIARGAQEQIATFFESDGEVVIHPEPSRFFEVPITGPLPEELNFISAGARAPASDTQASGPTLTDPAAWSPIIADLFAAGRCGGTAVGPGAVVAAFGTSQLATPLLDETLVLNSLQPQWLSGILLDPGLTVQDQLDPLALVSRAAATAAGPRHRLDLVFADPNAGLLTDGLVNDLDLIGLG